MFFPFLLFLAFPSWSAVRDPRVALMSGGAKIQVEEYCDGLASSARVVIFLHGSGGPQSENLPYRDELRRLRSEGYCVFVPHYLGATRGSAADPPRHYRTWARVVTDTLSYTKNARAVLVGYSLGASVALAAAAADSRVQGVVEFSGSLPDEYVPTAKLPPLLIFHGESDATVPAWNARQLVELCRQRQFNCEAHIWPGEGHVFSAAAVQRAEGLMGEFLLAHLAAH